MHFLLRNYLFLLVSSISRRLFSVTGGAAASSRCASPANVPAVVNVVVVTGKSHGRRGAEGTGQAEGRFLNLL